MPLTLCLYLILALSRILSPSEVISQEMKSETYTIQGGNFNMSLGTIYSENFRLTDLVGNSQSQIFTAKGFFAQSGFLNSAASDSFSFSTSPPAISFAKPQSSKMQEKSLRLTVSNSNLLGYSITTYQNQPLTTVQKSRTPTAAWPKRKFAVQIKQQPGLQKIFTDSATG